MKTRGVAKVKTEVGVTGVDDQANVGREVGTLDDCRTCFPEEIAITGRIGDGTLAISKRLRQAAARSLMESQEL